MPRGCCWYSIGDFFLDGMPGASVWVSLHLAIDSAGSYWMRAAGDEVQVEQFTSATDVVNLVEDYPGGLESLCHQFVGSKRFQEIYLIAKQRLDPNLADPDLAS